MNYDDHYHFCFPNESLWRELIDAQQAKDGHAIQQVVKAQVEEIGPDVRKSGAGQPEIITDPDIFLAYSPDVSLMAQHPADHEGLGTYEEELALVEQISDLRDVPFSELPSGLPEGLRKMSWFLRDYLIDEYASGESFGETEEEHDRLYSGKQPLRHVTKTGQKKKIENGRDICSLVHSDNPMIVASMIIGDLERLGIERRNCPKMEDGPGLTRFTSVGPPFLLGGYGEVLRRCGLLGFREKQTGYKRRPAQAIAALGRFLKSAFAELHPTHQSTGAMHYGYIASLVAYILYFYNGNAKLPNGSTVEYELLLLRDNVSDGRCWPGVHTRYDNSPYWKRFEALGIKIAKEHLR